MTCDHGESKKKTTPAGQCRTPNFGVLQATTDTLKTLQTYSSNVGGVWEVESRASFYYRRLQVKKPSKRYPGGDYPLGTAHAFHTENRSEKVRLV